jgi:hypothetical protein
MALDVVGRIVQVLELQTGASARGDWKKQEFILETEEQYPRKICISLWGDRISDIAGIQTGELITVSVALESREFNGRWYTDVRGWKIQRAGQVNAVSVQGVPSQVPPPPSSPSSTALSTDDFAKPEGDSFDDLPF